MMIRPLGSTTHSNDDVKINASHTNNTSTCKGESGDSKTPMVSARGQHTSPQALSPAHSFLTGDRWEIALVPKKDYFPSSMSSNGIASRKSLTRRGLERTSLQTQGARGCQSSRGCVQRMCVNDCARLPTRDSRLSSAQGIRTTCRQIWSTSTVHAARIGIWT